MGDRRFDWRLELTKKVPAFLEFRVFVVFVNPKHFCLSFSTFGYFSGLVFPALSLSSLFSREEEKQRRETERKMLLRVLLETVLATVVFFGLYGAADAVRFCFQFSFFLFLRVV